MKSAESKILEFEQDDSAKPVKEPKKKDPKEVTKKSGLKKLDPSTAAALQKLNEKANKKTYGRKIRDNEIIALALSLMQPEHLAKLQEQSLSEKDRLSIAHEEYQKNHGKLTLDQFIGKLIRGEIQLKTSTDSVKA